MEQQEAIKTFVRNVLGCSCPDEVFETIEWGPISPGNFHWLRILIGNRLLIYISRIHALGPLQEELPALLQAGRAERDQEGFNRFRAVVATTDRLGLEPTAHRIFNGWEDRDDDTFLHLVDHHHVVSFISG